MLIIITLEHRLKREGCSYEKQEPLLDYSHRIHRLKPEEFVNTIGAADFYRHGLKSIRELDSALTKIALSILKNMFVLSIFHLV